MLHSDLKIGMKVKVNVVGSHFIAGKDVNGEKGTVKAIHNGSFDIVWDNTALNSHMTGWYSPWFIPTRQYDFKIEVGMVLSDGFREFTITEIKQSTNPIYPKECHARNKTGIDMLFGYLYKDNYPSDYWANGWVVIKSSAPANTKQDGVNANDHTCLSCGNSRCNRTEKSCWKCGSEIKV